MTTVIVSTTNRPQMLRTALRSIAEQTARDEIGLVVVSENAGGKETEQVCAEFPSLPIRYVFREPPFRVSIEHGRALFDEASAEANEHVAILHDDDWWGPDHLANGLAHLRANPDALSYWSASFVVYGETSWFLQAWNESCWIASGFGPLMEVARLDRKQAGLAALGSGPAHYSTLIAQKDVLAEGYREATRTGNLFDNDRLLFLELAKRGIVLVNLVPEVFVRLHASQDQRSFTVDDSSEQIAAATRIVLDFCKQEGVDVLREFERLYKECPIPGYRPYIMEVFDPRVAAELRRQNALPLQNLRRERLSAKEYAQQLCPPIIWNTARQVSETMGRLAHRRRSTV